MEEFDNKTLILAEFERLKGQFVIVESLSWKVERLVAVGEDDVDYYWITYDGRRLNWHTCVISPIQLKGRLPDRDYNRLVKNAKMNDYDQITLWSNSDPDKFMEFNEAHKAEISKLREGESLLTPICWYIN